jgi:hypothetical protein
MLDIASEVPAHLRCVLLREVNLIGGAIDTEGDRLGRLRAVDVVSQLNCDPLSHCALLGLDGKASVKGA